MSACLSEHNSNIHPGFDVWLRVLETVNINVMLVALFLNI
jgi:hypothetical protein